MTHQLLGSASCCRVVSITIIKNKQTKTPSKLSKTNKQEKKIHKPKKPNPNRLIFIYLFILNFAGAAATCTTGCGVIVAPFTVPIGTIQILGYSAMLLLHEVSNKLLRCRGPCTSKKHRSPSQAFLVPSHFPSCETYSRKAFFVTSQTFCSYWFWLWKSFMRIAMGTNPSPGLGSAPVASQQR